MHGIDHGVDQWLHNVVGMDREADDSYPYPLCTCGAA